MHGRMTSSLAQVFLVTNCSFTLSVAAFIETWKLAFRKNSKCDFPDKPKILRASVQKI